MLLIQHIDLKRFGNGGSRSLYLIAKRAAIHRKARYPRHLHQMPAARIAHGHALDAHVLRMGELDARVLVAGVVKVAPHHLNVLVVVAGLRVRGIADANHVAIGQRRQPQADALQNKCRIAVETQGAANGIETRRHLDNIGVLGRRILARLEELSPNFRRRVRFYRRHLQNRLGKSRRCGGEYTD